MIWLTWRQQRLEALIGGVALGLVAVLLLWTGHAMVSSYDHTGVAACVAQHATDPACWPLSSAFQDRFARFGQLMPWLNFVPLFIGLLLAAPFVLDLEQGTHRLVWTQGITRRRWLAVKIGLMVGAAVAVSLALVALWTWWRGPFDGLQTRFDPNSFDFEGIAPVAYTLFALALCLAVGTILRRTAPAMAITFAVFLGLRVALESQLRPHYLAPLTLTWDPTSPTPVQALTRFGDGAWVLSTSFAVRPGQALADPPRPSAHASMRAPQAGRATLASRHTGS